MYTDFEARISIKAEEKNRKVIDFFKNIEKDIKNEPFSDHEFFNCFRMSSIIQGCKIFPDLAYSYGYKEGYVVEVRCSIKNYQKEIEKFCNFISEFTEDEIIGRSLHEASDLFIYHKRKL